MRSGRQVSPRRNGGLGEACRLYGSRGDGHFVAHRETGCGRVLLTGVAASLKGSTLALTSRAALCCASDRRFLAALSGANRNACGPAAFGGIIAPTWSRIGAAHMPVNLSIKNAPDEIVRRLRERASRHHRSLQGELLAILEAAVRFEEQLSTDNLLAEVQRLGLRTPSES